MCRILILEDNHELRPLLAGLLGEAGYDVLAVSTIAEAKVLQEKNDLDLAIIDMHLPNGEGIYIAKEMDKSIIKVMMIEGEYHYDEELFEDLNIVEVLVKPFCEEDIISLVDDLVEEFNIKVGPRSRSSQRRIKDKVDLRDIYTKQAIMVSRVNDIRERVHRVEDESSLLSTDRAHLQQAIKAVSDLSKMCPVRGEEIRVLQEQMTRRDQSWGRLINIVFIVINFVLTSIIAVMVARIFQIFNG